MPAGTSTCRAVSDINCTFSRILHPFHSYIITPYSST